MRSLKELGISPTPWKVGGDEDDMVFNECGDVVAEYVAERDMRLIAAAPKLYEALRLAYEEATGERIVVPKRGWVQLAKQALGQCA